MKLQCHLDNYHCVIFLCVWDFSSTSIPFFISELINKGDGKFCSLISFTYIYVHQSDAIFDGPAAI